MSDDGCKRIRVAMLADALAQVAVGSETAAAGALDYLTDPGEHEWPFSAVAICRELQMSHDALSAFAQYIAEGEIIDRREMADALRELVPHRVATPRQHLPDLITRPCPICGDLFTNRYPQRRTCSPPCAALFEKISHAEKAGRRLADGAPSRRVLAVVGVEGTGPARSRPKKERPAERSTPPAAVLRIVAG